VGDEGVQEAGTVLHLPEPGTDDHGELIECAGGEVANAAFEVRPVSGIFRVRFSVFMLGALVAGVGWIGMYVGFRTSSARRSRSASGMLARRWCSVCS
jgi:hypothetical protein